MTQNSRYSQQNKKKTSKLDRLDDTIEVLDVASDVALMARRSGSGASQLKLADIPVPVGIPTDPGLLTQMGTVISDGVGAAIDMAGDLASSSLELVGSVATGTLEVAGAVLEGAGNVAGAVLEGVGDILGSIAD